MAEAVSTIETPGSPSSAVDPLSQHIIARTGTSMPGGSTKTKTLGVSEAPSANNGSDSVSTGRNSSEILRADTGSTQLGMKDRKKGASFFSRIIGHKKKDHLEIVPNFAPTEPADDRPEERDVQPYTETFDGMSFSPRYPQPPAYIKISAQGKKKKAFDKLFLAQQLHDGQPRTLQRSATTSSMTRLRRVRTNEESKATWALEFSRDGRFVAAGGQESVVRVWATLQTPEDRRKFEKDEDAEHGPNDSSFHLKAPVFNDKPVRVFSGHTSPVLDLSWSKNNFLLSSSMDKTVRLWHVSRAECLCAFKHLDFVTSIAFHPKDDRFFLAGSLDSKLRLWSIPDKSVAFWNQVPEMVTAVSFTPDGKTAIAGCLTGLCLFYDTEGLKYQTQMHVKSTRGKNTTGNKITGIETMAFPPSDPHGDVKLLITSNDSRARLYRLRDKSLEIKFKGNENTSSQIHARFSDDARYVICGSEDKRVFVWSLEESVEQTRKDRRPVEVFDAHKAATTVCAIAPARLRQVLGTSEDPLYDLCNPPPVTLMSNAEVQSMHSGRAPDDNSSPPISPPLDHSTRKPEETPAYAARSVHPDGNVIVTADANGDIKVFRQDCAHEKRAQWDAQRKFSSNGIIHRNSSMTSSKRSLVQQDSSSTSHSRDRILSWRQSISTTSFDGVSGARRSSAFGNNGLPSNRSSSPQKFSFDSRSHRKGMFGSSPGIGNSNSTVIRTSSNDSFSLPHTNGSPNRASPKRQDSSSMPPPPLPRIGQVDGPKEESADVETPSSGRPQSQSQLQAPRPEVSRTNSSNSETYWQRDAWREQIIRQVKDAQSSREQRHLDGHSSNSDRLGVSRQGSTASALTDEMVTPEET